MGQPVSSSVPPSGVMALGEIRPVGCRRDPNSSRLAHWIGATVSADDTGAAWLRRLV